MCIDKQYTIKKHHIMQNAYSFKKNASLKLIWNSGEYRHALIVN